MTKMWWRAVPIPFHSSTAFSGTQETMLGDKRPEPPGHGDRQGKA